MGDPATFASDADREHTVALLREHHGAGRLTADELEARVALAYSARTHADLTGVMGGLPSQSPAIRGGGGVAATREGYSGGQVAAAAAITLFVPLGHLVGVVASAAMLRDERVPARRSMLRTWLAVSIALLAIDTALILVFVVR
jgi:hypothetical protein